MRLNTPSQLQRPGFLLPLALLTAVCLVARGDAGLIPGGGSPKKADCYGELQVEGIDNPSQRVEKNRKVLCTDGEACDTGPCGDRKCNMKVAACINQTDPNVPTCTPPSGLSKLKVSGAFNIQIPQLLTGSACGALLDVEIPLKGTETRPKAGKRKVTMKAKGVAGTKPKLDEDEYLIACIPRTVACPSTTTSTTT